MVYRTKNVSLRVKIMNSLRMMSKKHKAYFFNRVVVINLVIMLFAVFRSFSQDAQFTQFNMTPLHQNPAFTGNTYAPLIHLNSRAQWPGVDLAYNSVAVSYDQYFHRYRSGVGLFMLNDIAGKGIYNTFRMEALYAYNLRMRGNRSIRMGLSLAIVQNRLNWDRLIFYDQLDPDYGYVDESGVPNPSTELPPDRLTIWYPDLSAGLLYHSSSFYAGISIKHANSPEQGFLSQSVDSENGLALRYAVQVGGQIRFGYKGPGANNYIHPMLLFSQQANIRQLKAMTHIELGTIYAGLGYRHAFENPDALILTLGVELGMYTIGYSYDHTVSRLTVNTGGSHEIGVRINFDHSEWFDPPYRYSDCFEIFR